MPEISRESTSLAAVVGENCRRIRVDAGVTQNALAKHACDAGLRWTASKVGQFERGQYNPALSTFLAVSYALSTATGGVVVPADLVRSDGYVVINDRLDPQSDLLEAILRGKSPWNVGYDPADPLGPGLPPSQLGRTAELMRDPAYINAMVNFGSARLDDRLRYSEIPLKEYEAIRRQSGLDEQRVTKRLGITPELLIGASWQLWHQSFSEERDLRAGADASPQKRGHISRTLIQELREELSRGDDS